MKTLLVVAGCALVLGGCNQGTADVKKIDDDNAKIKEFNDKALQEKPPPAGDGPGN